MGNVINAKMSRKMLQAKQDIQRGRTVKETAERAGSREELVTKWCRRYGWRRVYSIAEMREMLWLLEHKRNMAWVSRSFGIPYDTLRSWVRAKKTGKKAGARAFNKSVAAGVQWQMIEVFGYRVDACKVLAGTDANDSFFDFLTWLKHIRPEKVQRAEALFKVYMYCLGYRENGLSAPVWLLENMNLINKQVMVPATEKLNSLNEFIDWVLKTNADNLGGIELFVTQYQHCISEPMQGFSLPVMELQNRLKRSGK